MIFHNYWKAIVITGMLELYAFFFFFFGLYESNVKNTFAAEYHIKQLKDLIS